MDSHDPEQAKKMLAEAGYANRFSTKIWQTRGGILPQLIQATAGYWSNVGVKAEIVNMDYTAFYAQSSPVRMPELYQSVWVLNSRAFYEFDGLLSGYHSKEGVPKSAPGHYAH